MDVKMEILLSTNSGFWKAPGLGAAWGRRGVPAHGRAGISFEVPLTPAIPGFRWLRTHHTFQGFYKPAHFLPWICRGALGSTHPWEKKNNNQTTFSLPVCPDWAQTHIPLLTSPFSWLHPRKFLPLPLSRLSGMRLGVLWSSRFWLQTTSWPCELLILHIRLYFKRNFLFFIHLRMIKASRQQLFERLEFTNSYKS